MNSRRLERVRFEEQGYLKLGKCLDARDLAAVSELIDRAFSEPTAPGSQKYDMGGAKARRIAVLHQPSVALPELRETTMYKRCREAASELLGAPAYYVYDYSIYKWPNNGHETPWHQDQAYRGHADDTGALHFWIPLQSVNVETGCMGFLPGSHKRGLLPHHRWGNDDDAKALEADGVDASGAVDVEMLAGEMLVFHPFTLHYSTPNRGEGTRRTWILHFGPHPKIDAATRLPVTRGASEQQHQ